MTIGYRIKDLRKSLGLTQEQLGEKVGVKKATINKYETGVVKNIPGPTLEKLAKALHTSPAFLHGWTGPEYDEHTGQRLPRNEEMTKEEAELLRIFRGLNVRNRVELISTAFRLEESQSK